MYDASGFSCPVRKIGHCNLLAPRRVRAFERRGFRGFQPVVPNPVFLIFLGRLILKSGLLIISIQCASQPGSLPSANITVNIFVGIPRAL